MATLVGAYLYQRTVNGRPRLPREGGSPISAHLSPPPPPHHHLEPASPPPGHVQLRFFEYQRGCLQCHQTHPPLWGPLSTQDPQRRWKSDNHDPGTQTATPARHRWSTSLKGQGTIRSWKLEVKFSEKSEVWKTQGRTEGGGFVSPSATQNPETHSKSRGLRGCGPDLHQTMDSTQVRPDDSDVAVGARGRHIKSAVPEGGRADAGLRHSGAVPHILQEGVRSRPPRGRRRQSDLEKLVISEAAPVALLVPGSTSKALLGLLYWSRAYTADQRDTGHRPVSLLVIPPPPPFSPPSAAAHTRGPPTHSSNTNGWYSLPRARHTHRWKMAAPDRTLRPNQQPVTTVQHLLSCEQK